jgi:hypothetical protein
MVVVVAVAAADAVNPTPGAPRTPYVYCQGTSFAGSHLGI